MHLWDGVEYAQRFLQLSVVPALVGARSSPWQPSLSLAASLAFLVAHLKAQPCVLFSPNHPFIHDDDDDDNNNNNNNNNNSNNNNNNNKLTHRLQLSKRSSAALTAQYYEDSEEIPRG